MRNRFKQQNFRNNPRGFGRHNAGGQCVCPRCGYALPHVPGLPCRGLFCPHCGSVLMNRNGSGAEFIDPDRQVSNRMAKSASPIFEEKITPRNDGAQTTHSVQSPSDFPIVDPVKCTGCGTCVDVCRRGAISLIDAIAVIDPALCINCRLCLRKCPSGALS